MGEAARRKEHLRKEYAESVTCVLAFLIWMEAERPATVYGARKIGDAVDAMCRLAGLDPLRARQEMLR